MDHEVKTDKHKHTTNFETSAFTSLVSQCSLGYTANAILSYILFGATSNVVLLHFAHVWKPEQTTGTGSIWSCIIVRIMSTPVSFQTHLKAKLRHVLIKPQTHRFKCSFQSLNSFHILQILLSAAVIASEKDSTKPSDWLFSESA